MTTTQVDDYLMRSPVSAQRDQFGRYLIVPEGGGKAVAHTRVTTFRDALDDQYNLTNWKIRTALKGVAERHDLYAAVAAARPDDKKTLDALGQQCLEAGKGSVGANLGSALHAFCERVDLGEELTIPKPWDGDVAAYTATLAAHQIGIIPEYVEQICVIPDLHLAGTFDRIVNFGTVPVIADLKTGNVEYSFLGTATQLACYAHAATIYNPATCEHTPMPQVRQDVALVIHLPAGTGTCNLWWVDIAAGWEAAQHCKTVRDWRKRKDLAEPWRPDLPVTEPATRAMRLRERAQQLPVAALAELASMWPEHVPTLKPSNTHTQDQLDLIALTISTIEARHQLPFGTLDPADSVAS